MARIFQTLTEAALEIRRDLAKAPLMTFSRVQQNTGLTLPGRELIAYEYGIAEGGIPDTIDELAAIGRELKFELFDDENLRSTLAWLHNEMTDRAYGGRDSLNSPPTEVNHPFLRSTLEGNHPSYTYRERLFGAVEAMAHHLMTNADSRRVYWPIYNPTDALRAGQPTRVPCSLGYQIVIRPVDEINRFIMIYLSRSCDYDRFWLSDVWLAHQFRRFVCEEVNALNHQNGAMYGVDDDNYVAGQPGSFHHFVSSFHSFTVSSQEIY